MADPTTDAVVTTPAQKATDYVQAVIDYSLAVTGTAERVGAVLVQPGRPKHVIMADILWGVLSVKEAHLRIANVRLGDLGRFATAAFRISKEPAVGQLGSDPPGFFAWTNSTHQVLVSHRMFEWANGTAVTASFLSQVVTILLRHEAKHVQQFRDNGGNPPASYGDMGEFEVDAYGETLDELRGLATSNDDEVQLKEGFVDSLETVTIPTAKKARDAGDEFTALQEFIAAELLPPKAKMPPKTLYVKHVP
jgi:hypothetical protein